MRFRTKSIVRFTSLPLFLYGSLSTAGGFSINEQSASVMGVANAGSAVHAHDASTVFFNPAGMSQLSGTNISVSAIALDISAELSEGSATAADGSTVAGGDGGDFVPLAVLPGIYVTHELNETVDLGLAIHAPYGLKGDYDDDFIGRFFADETELQVISVSPSIAFGSDDGISVGFGVNLMYAEGRLTRFQDYSGSQQRLNNAGYTGGTLEEGYFETEGDDFDVSYTVGLIYAMSPKTQLGLQVRTGVDFELDGDATLTGAPTVVPGAGGVSVTFPARQEDVTVPLSIPESITVGLKHELNDSFTLLAGATWAKWSRFEDLDIVSRADNAGEAGTISELAGPKYGQSDLVGHVSENWEDTWQFNLGGIWQVSPEWKLRAGYAYDQSPVNEKFRTARVPSDDRHWLTLGASYAHQPSGWSVDGAVGVFILPEVDVDEVEYTVDDEPVADSEARFQGSYDLSAVGLGIQVNKTF